MILALPSQRNSSISLFLKTSLQGRGKNSSNLLLQFNNDILSTADFLNDPVDKFETNSKGIDNKPEMLGLLSESAKSERNGYQARAACGKPRKPVHGSVQIFTLQITSHCFTHLCHLYEATQLIFTRENRTANHR